MSQFYQPGQTIYSDVYTQKNTDYETTHRRKYLSRISNQILRAISPNVVVSGLELTRCDYYWATIRLVFSPGFIIVDSTLIEITEDTIIEAEIDSPLQDTSHHCYLGVFTDFKYAETPDDDSQTELALSIYHVTYAGVPTPLTSPEIVTPAFNVSRNTLLISKIQFTRSGTPITSVSEVPLTLSDKQSPYIGLYGSKYYMRGYANYRNDGISSWDMLQTIYSRSLIQFTFHDMT